MAGSASTSKVTYYFYANDGTFPDGSNIISFNKPDTAVFTISGHVDQPSRDNYIFLGWSTASNSSNVVYGMNDNCDGSYGYTYYAVWKVDDSHDKCIFEKGAVDIIVDKIKAKTAGAAIETVNFNYIAHSSGRESGSEFKFYYIDSYGQPISTTILSTSKSFTIPVMKGCVVFAQGDNVDTMWSLSGASFYVHTDGWYGFAAVADGDITFEIMRTAPRK